MNELVEGLTGFVSAVGIAVSIVLMTPFAKAALGRGDRG